MEDKDRKLSKEQCDRIDRMKQYRHSGRWTQEAFAEKLGISLSGYKKIEAYENQISLETLKKLHEKCGLSADYILFGETSSQERAWGEISKCSEAAKIMIFLRLFRYMVLAKETVQIDDEPDWIAFQEVFRYPKDLGEENPEREE